MIKKTQYLDPKSHNSQPGGQTEFVIPVKAFREARLIDFGVQTYTSANSCGYAYNAGALSLIDTITVYSGSTEVAQCRGVAYLGAETQIMDSGAQNFSVGTSLYGSSLRYVPDVTIDGGLTAPALGSASFTYLDLKRILPFFLGLDLDGYSAMSKAVKAGKRRRVRELIAQSNVIPGDKLNLRIVIQYTTLPPDQLFVNALSTDTYTLSRPILVVDEILGAAPTDKFQMVYDTFDIENVTIPGAAAGNTTSTPSLRLQGADGYYLKDISLISARYPGNTLNTNFKGFASTAQKDEVMNLLVNSELIVPIDIDTPARKQMYLNYSNPSALCPILSNIFDHGGVPSLYTGTAETQTKQFSYVTLDVERKVFQMALQYSRLAYDTYQAEPINMVALYRIQNVLSYQNGSVAVSK